MKAHTRKVSAANTKPYPFTGQFGALDVICGNERSDELCSHIQRLWKDVRMWSVSRFEGSRVDFCVSDTLNNMKV